MSDIVATFNPVTNNSQTFPAPQTSAQGSLVFWNESNNSIFLTFQDGSRSYLPAWYHKHKCGPTGNVDIKWDVHAVLSSSNPPTSEVIVEAYAHGETFPADGPLVRQTNGTTITSSVTTLTTLINDGAAVGTTIMESTPGTFPQSSVLLTNNGQLTLGDTSNQNGVITVNGTITVSGPVALQNNVTVGGIFKIAASQIGKTVAGDILDASGPNFIVKSAAGGAFQHQAPSGTNVWTRTMETFGAITVGAGATVTITHGINVNGVATAPEMINVCPVNTTAIAGPWAAVNKTATTFQIFNGHTASQVFEWQCIKR